MADTELQAKIRVALTSYAIAAVLSQEEFLPILTTWMLKYELDSESQEQRAEFIVSMAAAIAFTYHTF